MTESAKAGLPAHEKVYRKLRSRVLFGELAPGQPVTIQGLVADLGAGMTPVREALRRLIAEGALAFQGNRRIIVPSLDEAAVDQLRVARLALEPELARRATTNVTEDDILHLRRIDAHVDEAIAAGDARDYLERNHAFHSLLYSRAEAPILEDMVQGLWLRFGPSLRVISEVRETRALTDHHKSLIEALESEDGEAAALAIASDIQQGMSQIEAALD